MKKPQNRDAEQTGKGTCSALPSSDGRATKALGSDSPSTTPSSRRRGRPRAGVDMAVVDRLLGALEECLQDHSYLDVGLREISARAGTSHAMIGYYFIDKHGLLAALVERVLDAMIDDLRQLRVHILSIATSPTEQVLLCMADHLARHPEVARLAVTEAGRNGSTIGDRLKRRQMPRILAACHAIVRDLIEAGVYRPDLERVFAANALAGLSTLGLIALPSVPNLGIEPSGFSNKRWIAFMAAALDSQFMREGGVA